MENVCSQWCYLAGVVKKSNGTSLHFPQFNNIMTTTWVSTGLGGLILNIDFG